MHADDGATTYSVYTVRPCHVQARVHDRLGNQLMTVRQLAVFSTINATAGAQVLSSVFVAAQLRTNLSIYHNPNRVASKADRPDLAGLFEEQSVTTHWDFRPKGMCAPPPLAMSPRSNHRQSHTLHGTTATQRLGLL